MKLKQPSEIPFPMIHRHRVDTVPKDPIAEIQCGKDEPQDGKPARLQRVEPQPHSVHSVTSTVAPLHGNDGASESNHHWSVWCFPVSPQRPPR